MAYIPENARLIDNPVSTALDLKLKMYGLWQEFQKYVIMFLESVEPN